MATAVKTKKKANARLLSLQERSQILIAFGRRLEQLRLQKGLTPSEFDAKSGIDAGNLSKYEQGNREPGLVVIFIMAKALEVNPSVLMDFEVPWIESNVNDRKHHKDPIELIRSLMKERNMKSKDLVDVLGVSKGHVSSILHYKKGLSKQNIRTLAEYFNIDIALLFGED